MTTPIEPGAAGREFVRDFQRAVSAGFTLLGVSTGEEARARDLIAKACGKMPVVYWSHASPTPIAEALAKAAASEAKELHVFVDLGAALDDPHVRRALREIAIGARRALVLLLASSLDVPADLEREMAYIELPLPDRAELAALYDRTAQATPRHRAPADPQEAPPDARDRDAFVRAAAGLTTSEAARAFRLAHAEHDASAALRRVIAEKRRGLARTATLELVDDDVSLGDVGGLDVVKAWLASRVRAYGEDARAYGLPEPRGMLLCGVQGCGKSHVSKAAASVLGLPLVRLDFASLFAATSPEQALRECLRAVTAIAPLVLWVDEIEKGLGGGVDGRQVRVFGAFLTWLQERTAPVFVAATANEVAQLPPELARRGRFDEVFFVDLPSAREREEILAVALRRRGRSHEGLPLASIAKPLEQYSGAELEQIVGNALFRAFGQKREITEEDLRAAAREVVPLATLYEEKVQALRTWGKTRARRASADTRMLELFDP
ncbi:MAG: AAA family ATPase [Deltaproteobacteria bacterium]|nr:AAA family ATPase [Deltaproteobacteria bacterium]